MSKKKKREAELLDQQALGLIEIAKKKLKEYLSKKVEHAEA